MQLVLEGRSPARLATSTRSRRIAALNDKVLDDAMEDGLAVVLLHAELNEVPACFGALSGPKLDLDVSCCRLEQHLAKSRRFLNVYVAHFHPDPWSRTITTFGPNTLVGISRENITYMFKTFTACFNYSKPFRKGTKTVQCISALFFLFLLDVCLFFLLTVSGLLNEYRLLYYCII